jgi:phosphoadenosine phosphosulfate reductase
MADATVHRFVELAVDFFGERLAMTTSFGINSAVMLHLITRVKSDIPVIWIDTGYLFPETYRFAEELTKRLGLNLKVYQSHLSPARMEALQGRLWAEKTKEALDRYHLIRKVEPLQRAFKEMNVQAWFTGLRAYQTDYRRTLDRIHWIDGRYRLLPILDWDSQAVENYLNRNNLPSHPLREERYGSVGDWHSSRPLSANDKSERETRFQGLKQECGMHLPLTPEAEKSLRSSGL